MQASVNQIPTQDPNPPACSAGSASPLELQGNADPQQTQEQKAEVEKSAADARLKGEQEAAQPMGEDELYSTLPTEMLTAQTTAQGAGGDAAAIAEGASAQVADMAGGVDAASIIAQEEKGAEIQAAIAQAQGGIANERAQHQAKVAEEEAKSSQQIEQLKQENAAQQDAERTRAQGEVEQLRGEWTQEQEAMVAEARSESDVLVSDGLAEVESERLTAESEATQEIQKGEENAEAERVKGEENAAKEKAAGEEKSKGFFGKVADAVGSVFEGIKNAIKAAIDKARQLMCAAIDAAKKLATAAIERGRKAIVGVIKRVGDGLIAVGDRLLAKFPETRDRFRNTIQEKVQQAEDAVNKLAEDLNNGIQEALDLLATGLDAALGLMEAGMVLVVDGLSAAITGPLELADNFIATTGELASVIPDIAAGPGQWVLNLGAGAKDGTQKHLWGAMQSQMQQWFSEKVTAIIGTSPEELQQIAEGGISMGEIATLAWNAIKVAVPAILIGLVIEKIVSMIVPAVGALKTIVEFLMAALGSVGPLMAAFGAYVVFLKAVKGGNAGPQFAAMVASVGVAVVDFISNWLIEKLKKAAKNFAAKLKGIAKSASKKFNRTKSNSKGKKDAGSEPQKTNKEKETLKKTEDKDDINKLTDEELKTELEIAEKKNGGLKDGEEAPVGNGHELTLSKGMICRASKKRKCKKIPSSQSDSVNSHALKAGEHSTPESHSSNTQRTYEPNSKHGQTTKRTKRGNANPAPSNPHTSLENSIELPGNTTRRVSIDKEAGEFVVFDEHTPGKFHGHTREWSELSQTMKNVLIKAGLVSRKDKVK
ncbi:hypothetical protein [Baaleninema simplex]|uniref:hypothetical protein n=1 Tax=Baaleninema simplex TaxID=2862350 RepID=UPI00034A9483|nr:hypothetical protein [Baaleninema simplex]